MRTEELSLKLKEYAMEQIANLAKTNPMIGFIKPLASRALEKNFHKIEKLMDLISDKEGNVDIENILPEMTESLMNSEPFVFHTEVLGDIGIGGGKLTFNLPVVNKALVIDVKDLETLKEAMLWKN